MQDKNFPLQLNPIHVIAILVEALFIVFAIITFNQIINTGNHAAVVKIDNYSEVGNSNNANVEGALSDVKSEHRDIINKAVYDIAALNNTGNINNFGAKIREGSVSNVYLEELGMNFVHFIVDVEDLGQSYELVYRWIKDMPKDKDLKDIPMVVAYCPKAEDLIYGNFDCKDEYNGTGEARVVYETLQFHEFNNARFSIIGNPSVGEKLSISILTPTDYETDKSKAIAEFSEYMNSLGFDLEDYEYAASTCGFCGPQD